MNTGIVIKDRYIWEIYEDFKKHMAYIIGLGMPKLADIDHNIVINITSTELYIQETYDAYYLNAIIPISQNPLMNEELVRALKEKATEVSSGGFHFVLKIDKSSIKPSPFPENFKVVEGVRGYNSYGFYYTNDDTNVYLSAVYSLPDCAPGTWELFIGYKDGSETGEVVGSNMSLEECIDLLNENMNKLEA